MHFEINHTFTAPIDRVAATLLDESYQAALADVSPALESRELLSQEEVAGGKVLRRVRCVLGIDLGPARRFIGSSEPAWVEEATWDPSAQIWSWTILPEVGSDILSAHGDVALKDGEGTTVRVVTGEVKIRVPLYGGRVEGWIVDGLRQGYDAEAQRLEAWLREAT